MSHSELNRPISEEAILKARGYTFVKKLGEGTYAKVFLTEYKSESDPDENHTLACKIIDTTKTSKIVARKFLPRELQILSKLKHPFIINVHSIFKKRSKYFIFMPLAENGDLLNYVQKHGPIPENQARIWLRQLILAVQYIHEMEIVHRDIKCENVLLTSELNLRLADFGFARFVVDNRGKRVLSDTYCGSLLYAAPEVVRSVPYNPKVSDMWSIGVTLFIILNKSIPFDDKNIRHLYELQVNRRYKFRSQVVSVLSDEVKKLVDKLLEPDILKRWKIEQVLKCEWLAMDPKLTMLSSEEKDALDNAIEERKKFQEKLLKAKEAKRYVQGETEETGHHETEKNAEVQINDMIAVIKQASDFRKTLMTNLGKNSSSELEETV